MQDRKPWPLIVGGFLFGGVMIALPFLSRRRELAEDWPSDGERSIAEPPPHEEQPEAAAPSLIPISTEVPLPAPRDLRFVPRTRLDRVLAAIRRAREEALRNPRMGEDTPPLEWFIAIAGTESSFDPTARRPNSRFYGLYQFHEGLARDLGWRGRSMTELFDPLLASRLMARAFIYYRRRARSRCLSDTFADAAAMHNIGHTACAATAHDRWRRFYLPQATVELERAARELV